MSWIVCLRIEDERWIPAKPLCCFSNSIGISNTETSLTSYMHVAVPDCLNGTPQFFGRATGEILAPCYRQIIFIGPQRKCGNRRSKHDIELAPFSTGHLGLNQEA